jgi:hypothetical protein
MKKSCKAQVALSFGMIFSIVLIIIFLGFGFYAIKKMLDLQSSVQVEKFLSDLQSDVDKMWKSVQGSQSVTYSLPTKITSICFQEDEFENLKFNSKTLIKGTNIENIDIETTLEDENPFCIQNVKGKVNFKLVKGYGKTLVTITK